MAVSFQGGHGRASVNLDIGALLDAIDEVRGLDITITTTAATDAEAFTLLLALGMPFAAQGRPAGFDALDAEQGSSA